MTDTHAEGSFEGDVAAAAARPVLVTAPPPGLNPPAPVPAAPNGRRQRRWLTWLARILGALLILALVALSVYLVVVTRAWEERVDTLTEISHDLGNDLAAEQLARAEAEDALETTQRQLDTATERITSLANEEANATDNQSVLVDYVAAMKDCADARQEHIDVLTNGNLYYPGKTKAQVERDITAYCDEVAADFAVFEAEEIGS